MINLPGTEDRCEPQPIPAILVGSEKDWIALSPLAIKFWEKLLLEPYSYPRDVAYLVMAPDNDFICQKVRLFFREFSSMYEVSVMNGEYLFMYLQGHKFARVRNSCVLINSNKSTLMSKGIK